MFHKIQKTIGISLVLLLLLTMITGCQQSQPNGKPGLPDSLSGMNPPTNNQNTDSSTYTGESVLDRNNQFTERDFDLEVDYSTATNLFVENDKEITIDQQGVYVLKGTAKNCTIIVNVLDDEKVQLVLDDVHITNEKRSCIVISNSDKVWITTKTDSSLTVESSFDTTVEDKDAVIYSCDDLVLNGEATLTISSSDKAVKSNDDLKVTSGTYIISAQTAFKANDSIRIADGNFQLTVQQDGIHAENKDDDSLGYIYIASGNFNILAKDDGIHANSVVQIDDGNFTIEAKEGIEATYVQINGGTIQVQASDDGINAAKKSTAYLVAIEITGGEIRIVMGPGDTDGLDSNGDMVVSGGTIQVTGNSTFDYDGNAYYTSGTIIVNGEQVSGIPESMMPGRNPGFGGGKGDRPPR